MKKLDYKYYDFDIPIYEAVGCVYLGDLKHLHEFIIDRYNLDVADLDEDLMSASGLMLDMRRYGIESEYLIIYSNQMIEEYQKNQGYFFSILAHECLHAATAILDTRKIQVTAANDEAVAYLMGWLMRKVFTRLQKAMKIVKPPVVKKVKKEKKEND